MNFSSFCSSKFDWNRLKANISRMAWVCVCVRRHHACMRGIMSEEISNAPITNRYSSAASTTKYMHKRISWHLTEYVCGSSALKIILPTHQYIRKPCTTYIYYYHHHHHRSFMITATCIWKFWSSAIRFIYPISLPQNTMCVVCGHSTPNLKFIISISCVGWWEAAASNGRWQHRRRCNITFVNRLTHAQRAIVQ